MSIINIEHAEMHLQHSLPTVIERNGSKYYFKKVHREFSRDYISKDLITHIEYDDLCGNLLLVQKDHPVRVKDL